MADVSNSNIVADYAGFNFNTFLYVHSSFLRDARELPSNLFSIHVNFFTKSLAAQMVTAPIKLLALINVRLNTKVIVPCGI